MFFIQHSYEISDGNQFCYNFLLRNGRDILPLKGTSGCHRNHDMWQIFLPIQRNVLQVSYFHMPHQKVWFQDVEFYEKKINKKVR